MSRVLLYDAMTTPNPKSARNDSPNLTLPEPPGRPTCRFHRVIAVIMLAFLGIHHLPAFAQGTAFTYQGRLTEAAGPANGTYDFTFQLFDSVTCRLHLTLL